MHCHEALFDTLLVDAYPCARITAQHHRCDLRVTPRRSTWVASALFIERKS